MAGGSEVGLGLGADDIIARIMAEIEDVIALIEQPFRNPRPVASPVPAGEALSRPEPT